MGFPTADERCVQTVRHQMKLITKLRAKNARLNARVRKLIIELVEVEGGDVDAVMETLDSEGWE